MKNVRAALNRFFREIGRNLNIVKDRDFQEANYMLDAKLKTNLKAGLSIPTEYTPIIPPEDMKDIFKYVSTNNPVAMRYRVWYILSVQYVSRGIEFHPQMNQNSLKLCRDENGHEYFILGGHEIKEKQN